MSAVLECPDPLEYARLTEYRNLDESIRSNEECAITMRWKLGRILVGAD
jgi:hypothetical protein